MLLKSAMKRHFIIQYVLTIAILFVLVWVWEFLIESSLPADLESNKEHWEYVFTVVVFGMIALVIPTIISIKEWNEKQKAINDIKTLKGLIPICMLCKNIKNDQGAWKQLEEYLTDNSDASFTHGVCPDCFQKELEVIEQVKEDETDPDGGSKKKCGSKQFSA